MLGKVGGTFDGIPAVVLGGNMGGVLVGKLLVVVLATAGRAAWGSSSTSCFQSACEQSRLSP